MTDLADLVVTIKADASQLKSEMSNAGKAVKESSSNMTESLGTVREALGALGLALSAEAFTEFVRGSLEAADKLYDLSLRTGIAASTLSALNIPLKQSGGSVEEFAASMQFLSRNIELAAQGNKELLDRFTDLGLSVTKLKALSPEQQFYAWAQALGQISDQGRLMADAMATGGRGVAALVPTIREANGNLAEFVETAKKAGDALTDEDIKKVNEFEDAWTSMVEHSKIKTVEWITTLSDLWNEYDKLIDLVRNNPLSNNWLTKAINGGTAQGALAALGINASQNTLDTLSPILNSQKITKKAPPVASAKGGNADISTGTGDDSLVDVEVESFIQDLKDEAEALGLSKDALAQYRAEKEGAQRALTDFNNGLRDSPDLTDAETQAIDNATLALEKQKAAQEELTKAEDKHRQMVAQMDAEIASSLADIVVNYKNAGSAITGVIETIAKKILEQKITTPLTNSLSSLLDSGSSSSGGLFSGFRKLLGFASGGNPPVGVPSIVGENGPELFIPNQAGTIIPNNKLSGGTAITIVQNINVSPGVPELVTAGIRASAPAIAKMGRDMVAGELASNGPLKRLVA